MNEFNDAEFDVLVTVDAERQDEADKYALLRQKAETFLTSRGVLLQSDDSAGYEQRADVAENRLQLHEMLAQVAMNKLIAANIEPDVAELLKKRIQAGFKIKELPPAWHDFVDAELPGDSLNEADQDIVNEVLIEQFSLQIDNDETLAAVYTAIEEFVSEAGLTVLTLEDEEVARLLATTYAMFTKRGKPWQEQARIILINEGLADNAIWQSVINQLAD